MRRTGKLIWTELVMNKLRRTLFVILLSLILLLLMLKLFSPLLNTGTQTADFIFWIIFWTCFYIGVHTKSFLDKIYDPVNCATKEVKQSDESTPRGKPQ